MPLSSEPPTVSVSHQLAGGGVAATSAARARPPERQRKPPARPRKVPAQRAGTRMDFSERGMTYLPAEPLVDPQGAPQNYFCNIRQGFLAHSSATRCTFATVCATTRHPMSSNWAYFPLKDLASPRLPGGRRYPASKRQRLDLFNARQRLYRGEQLFRDRA